MYSIYASFRHPDTGREVGKVELDISDESKQAESIVESYSRTIHNLLIVKNMLTHIETNNQYVPLVVVMKELI